MVLAAPELVVAEAIHVLGEIEVPAELERRVLPDGMVGSEKCAETQSGHEAPCVIADGIVSRRRFYGLAG
jgi:hypothetical protein